MMNEIELLGELTKVNQQILSLTIWKSQYVDNEKKIAEIDLKLANLEKKKMEVICKLQKVDSKESSFLAKKLLLMQLKAYGDALNNVDTSLSISQSQGLVIPNHFYSMLYLDIERLITSEPFGIHVPIGLRYTSDPSDSVDGTRLLSFLNDEYEILFKIDHIDYIKLIDFTESFCRKLIEQFVQP